MQFMLEPVEIIATHLLRNITLMILFWMCNFGINFVRWSVYTNRRHLFEDLGESAAPATEPSKSHLQDTFYFVGYDILFTFYKREFLAIWHSFIYFIALTWTILWM